jgi:Glycosyl hydrolase family 76
MRDKKYVNGKQPDWAREAERATQWCLDNLWIPEKGRFRPATPMAKNALPYDFMWGNGVAFSMLVGAARASPAKYQPILSRFFDGLEGYWDTRADVPGYDAYLSSPGNSDKYYDDNAWMVITFIEAWELTQERKYLKRAVQALDFVLSGWDERLGGGIYWKEDHKSKNTCSNAPSAMAVLCVARHLPAYKPWAARILDWTQKNLQASNGLYADNISCDSKKIEQTQWTYNTALMIRSHVAMHEKTKDKQQINEALRLARVSEGVFVNSKTGAFRDEANFSHLLVEAYLELEKNMLAKEPFLLARAESNGRFVLEHLWDKNNGGFWTKWEINPSRNEPRKTLMANASTARMLWLLAQSQKRIKEREEASL